MGLRIKALNADNALEVRALISLFDRASAAGVQPYPAVLSEEFWQTRVPQQLTSVVAIDRNVVQAHLSLTVEDSDAHVLFAVVDPQLENGSDVLAKLWQHMRQSPRLANLRSLTITIPQASSAVEEFAKHTLGARLCCLLPEHTPAPSGRAATILGTCSQTQRLPDTLKMRIPARYRAFASSLLAEYGILASYLDISNAPRAVSADARSVVTYTYREVQSQHLFVEPSLLSNWRDLDLDNNFKNFIFVDARDVKCTEFCDMLESQGYVFSGILPFVFGRTSVVLSPPPSNSISQNAFDDERIQELADGMLGEPVAQQPARRASASRRS